MSAEPFLNFENLYSPEDLAFFAELTREDDIGLILRVHMHCDRIVTRMVQKYVPRAQQRRWRFIHRVRRLAADGMIDANTLERMEWLNKIRNRLAHELQRELTVADYEDLMNASGIAGRRSVNEVNAYERDRTARHLISNALFIWRNNLCYIEDKGVAAHEEVRRWQEHQARVFENWEESPYDLDLE